jgi:hypothetical protein
LAQGSIGQVRCGAVAPVRKSGPDDSLKFR